MTKTIISALGFFIFLAAPIIANAQGANRFKALHPATTPDAPKLPEINTDLKNNIDASLQDLNALMKEYDAQLASKGATPATEAEKKEIQQLKQRKAKLTKTIASLNQVSQYKEIADAPDLIEALKAISDSANVQLYNDYTDARQEILDKIGKDPGNKAYLIQELEKEEQQYHKRLDDLKELENTIQKLQYYKERKGSWKKNFFPAGTSSTKAALYYDNKVSKTNEKLLGNTQLILNSSTGSVAVLNELYHDFIGPVRMGLGVLVSPTSGTSTATDKTPQEIQSAAVQRLISGGGNIAITGAYPLFDYTGKASRFSVQFINRMSLDIPRIGTQSTNYAFNNTTGFETDFIISGANKTFVIFAGAGAYYNRGNTPFRTAIGLKPGDFDFFSRHINIGLAIDSKYRIIFKNNFTGNDELKSNFKPTISFQLIPN